MDKAVAFLAKAVAGTAAVAFLLAVVIMIDAGAALPLPLLILSVVSGAYAFRVLAGNSREARLASTTNPTRVLINT